MGVDLRHLQAFVVVAEEGHVGRAAGRLHLTQPSVSRRIAALEAAVGEQLFVRTTSGMDLTPEGRARLVVAREALQGVDTALRRTGEERAPDPVVVLAFECEIGRRLAPVVARTWADAHHRARIVLFEALHDEQVQRLRAGTVDVGLLRTPTPPTDLGDLHPETLHEEPVAIAVPADSPYGRLAPPLPLDALRDERWLLMDPVRHDGPHAAVLARCHEHGFTPKVVATSASLFANLASVAGGAGVFPCPASTTVPAGVRLIPLAGWTTTVTLVRRRGEPPFVADLIEVVRAAASTAEQAVTPDQTRGRDRPRDGAPWG